MHNVHITQSKINIKHTNSDTHCKFIKFYNVNVLSHCRKVCLVVESDRQEKVWHNAGNFCSLILTCVLQFMFSSLMVPQLPPLDDKLKCKISELLLCYHKAEAFSKVGHPLLPSLILPFME